MSDAAAQAEEKIEVRPMGRQDAEGLVELVRSTYGDDYVHEEIYHPDLFFAAQERGREGGRPLGVHLPWPAGRRERNDDHPPRLPGARNRHRP